MIVTLWRIPSLLICSTFTVSMFVWCRRLLAVQATFAEVERTHLVSGLEIRNKVCGMNAVRTLEHCRLVAIVLSLSSISNSWLPIPCVAMSSVKSSYTLDFVLWLIERVSFHEVIAAYFPSRAELQDLHTLNVLLPQLFPECPWVYKKGDWTFWTQDMMWLAYVF